MRRTLSVLDRRGPTCHHKEIVSLYLENTPEERSSRLSPSSDPNRNQLKTSEDFELVYFAFPLRRKILTLLLAKIDCNAREVTQNITRWRYWIVNSSILLFQHRKCWLASSSIWYTRRAKSRITRWLTITMWLISPMTIEPWRLGRKNRKRTTLPWFPADQSKERRVPRQPKRAQQIAKLRLFVWDMMRWTYTQRSMGMVNVYWMKHIAWCLTKRRFQPPPGN